MLKTLLPEPEQIAQRQRDIGRRGLHGWPSDTPEDLLHIERFRLWLSALGQQATLEHPLQPLKLPVQRGFSPRMAYYFALGDYEQADLQLIDEYIRSGDRVMECGVGAGVTGSLAGLRSGNPVCLVEPNERLYPQIARTFAVNGQQYQLVEAAVVADAFVGEQLQLAVFDEYWWSSSVAREHPDHLPSVPVRRLSGLLAEYRPTVLILDIEGAEQGLFPASLPEELRLIMLEIHTPDIGDRATAEIVSSIMGQGFRLCRLLAQTWLFERC